MTAYSPSDATAYVNHGRWVADCPQPGCTNAIALTPNQSLFHCAGLGGCQQVSTVAWPVGADDIWAELRRRPSESNQHWAPADHRQALVCGFPDGQTVADLRAETEGGR